MTHRRSPSHGKEGVGEFLQVETDRDEQILRVEHPLPKARVLNELEVKLWVRAEQPGLKICLRVVLPDCPDPATGRPLAILIPGDELEEAGEWQELTCRTEDKLVEQRLQWLRAKVKQPLTPKALIADRVILMWPIARGVNSLSLDELTFGPVIAPENVDVSHVDHEEESAEPPPVQFRLDRMEVEGRPFFPRIVPYHGEPLKDLAAAQFNVVWVPDYADRALLTSIRREGLWATATPPTPLGSDGDALPASEAGLLPFSGETRPIAFWMLGTRISPQMQTRLLSWVDQVQAADHKYHRPLAADVSGEEKIFSRELNMLGISRHIIGSSLTFNDYRDWLEERQSWARPGSFCWTWIQVMPSPAETLVFDQHRVAQQIEPEQIRLQVYAALAAGVRGIGFWTPRALSEDTPADRETLEAIRQINLELWLLEPWLATTKSVMSIPVTVGLNLPRPKGRQGKRPAANTEAAKKLREDREKAEIAERQAREQLERQLSAAVLRTDYGTLLLPMWFDDDSQFVPDRLSADTITITVPGVSQTATAWEITTTGVHNLESQSDTGGKRITLRNFDQTACILLTSDLTLVQQTKQRVAAIQEQSARTWLALADLKLDRVRDIDQRLSEWNLRQPQAPQWLGAGRDAFLDAKEAANKQDWNRVRRQSMFALQMTRVLQRAHWEDAVRNLPSPVSTPLAVSFQTLPAQARLALQMAQQPAAAEKNLLPGGNFEDFDTQMAAGWKHEQDAPDGVQAGAELHQTAHQGKYGLRLIAAPARQPAPPILGGRELVRYITPPITVHAGQAVRIGGWIKVPAEISDSADGVVIYDGLLGRSLALRFRQETDWQRFEFVREVWESQDLTVTIALTGLGEVYLDDLEVTVHPLNDVAPAAAQEPIGQPRKAGGLGRWPDWRRLNPLNR